MSAVCVNSSMEMVVVSSDQAGATSLRNTPLATSKHRYENPISHSCNRFVDQTCVLPLRGQKSRDSASRVDATRMFSSLTFGTTLARWLLRPRSCEDRRQYRL
jgi:hypothetical protein